jgi:hypothetical protein
MHFPRLPHKVNEAIKKYTCRECGLPARVSWWRLGAKLPSVSLSQNSKELARPEQGRRSRSHLYKDDVLPVHDSGPGRLATPYPYDSCIRDFTPVYPGAFQLASKYCQIRFKTESMTQNKARRIDFLQLPWAQEVPSSNLGAPTTNLLN